MLRENIRYLIIAAAIIMATGIYSCSTRYAVINDPAYSRTVIVDRWTGKVSVRH